MVPIGSAAIFIGYSLVGTNSRIRINSRIEQGTHYYSRFTIFYYIALAFAIFIIIKQIIVLLPILLASGIAESRTEMSLDNLFLEGDWAILMNYFARPFVKASLIIMVVNLFRNKIKIKDVLLLLLLLIVAFASEGGRLLIMDVFFAFIYMLYVNRKMLAKKTKRAMNKVAMIVFGIAILATLDRGSSVIDSLYTYYCGGLTFFDLMINNNSQMFDPSLYGLNCYQGLLKPLYGILEYIGIPKPENLILADKFILATQDNAADIAPNIEINYFITMFGYAYRDGGLLFVFLDMLVYGCLCFLIDKKEFEKWGDVRWTTIKIVFFYTMLYTMAASPFATYMPTMTVVYIFVITNRMFSKNVLKNSY